MTRNQISALQLQEEKRHNQEMERMNKATIPAQYISSVGSLVRGSGGFISSIKPSAPAPVRSKYAGRPGPTSFILN